MNPTGSFPAVLRPDLDPLEVNPELELELVEAISAPRPAMNFSPGGVSATFDPCEILGRPAVLQLVYEKGTLRRASIFIRLPDDTTDWSDWTLAQEMARKRQHDALALALFGVALTPKPLDINGKPILPLELTPEHPNHAVFPWGEIISGYDSKGSVASMWIDYAGPRA